MSELSRLNGLSKAESQKFVELFFDAMADTLSQGDRVEIRGLCAFKVKEYPSYTGRNTKTGESVSVIPMQGNSKTKGEPLKGKPMEKVTQEEMHKVFSDHLVILKQDFKYGVLGKNP
ncbi:MAG: integration host factor subunit beta [Desulfobacteraceae bacterium]|nr:integration host factor subunit beta [Desulfobacteraceae bacterium]